MPADNDDHQGEAQRLLKQAGVQPVTRRKPSRGEEENAHGAQRDVGVQPGIVAMSRADLDEDDADRAASQKEEPANAREPRFLAQGAAE